MQSSVGGFRLNEKISEDVIEERFKTVYEAQKKIADQKTKNQLGKVLEVMVEGYHEESDLLVKARYFGQAPDIDGCVIINDTKDLTLNAGDFVKVKITDQYAYDLVGELIN